MIRFYKASPVVVIVAVVIIVAAVTGIYLFVHRTSPANHYASALTSGIKLLAAGEVSSTVAAEEAVKSAGTSNEEANAKILLGTSYLLSDESKGIATLQEVAGQGSYAGIYRVIAINEVADRFEARFYELAPDQRDQFFHTVFSGAPWSSFGSAATSSVSDIAAELTVRSAYEWSLSLASSSQAEYWMGLFYSHQAILGKSPEARKHDTALTLEYLAQGDDDLQKVAAANLPGIGLYIVQNDILKGRALSSLYIAGTVTDKNQVEAPLKNAITTAAQYPGWPAIQSTGIFGRYFLAAFIAYADGLSGQKEIQSILTPIYFSHYQGFSNFLKAQSPDVRFSPGSSAYDMMRLARIDPRFANLLLGVGWPASALKLK